MRCAIYTRVSLRRQVEGLSLDAQERLCREAAAREGATAVDIYREEGRSGKTLKRKALLALLSHLPEYGLLLTWRFDRLSRGDRRD